MPSLPAALLAGAVMLLALLAALRLVFGFRQFLRYRKYEPVEPYVEVNVPEPVIRTVGVELVAWLAIGWSVTNLAILSAAALTLRERAMLSSVPMRVSLMVYALVATVLVGWGGVMLLRLMAYGRRTLAWGVALFGIMNVFFFAFCLFLRQYRDTPLDVRRLMIPVAVVLAAHTLVGTAIGVAAQHVGLAAETGGQRGGDSVAH